MLKNFRLIAMVFVIIASCFEAMAQTEKFKEVFLNGKPAKLNLVTGEVTYVNGDIAKSRAAKKIKDSLLATRTEIKTNLLLDLKTVSESPQNESNLEISSTTRITTTEVEKTIDSEKNPITDSVSEIKNDTISNRSIEELDLASEVTEDNSVEYSGIYESNYHIVRKGETLYELSQRFDTSLGQLKLANNLETTLIREGQELRVRNFDSSETYAKGQWIVTKGDTLYSIAKKNNTTVEEIKILNGLSTSLIKIGQKLQLNENSVLSKK